MSTQPAHEGHRIVDQVTDRDVDGFDEHEWRTLRQLFADADRPGEFIDDQGNSVMVP